jgi:UDP-sulfoquinovose synthase
VENPPEAGEFRVLNQFAETFSIQDLAMRVAAAGASAGLPVTIEYLGNPRMEAEEHYYNPKHGGLFELGYQPTSLSNDVQPDRLLARASPPPPA